MLKTIKTTLVAMATVVVVNLLVVAAVLIALRIVSN